jgi:xylem cysteine proteinase
MKLVILLLTIVTLSTQKFIANQKFSTWMVDHGMKLNNLTETIQVQQQKSFLDNSQLIEQHNKKSSDFELGLNDFAYLNKEEFVKFYCNTKMPKKFLPDRPKLQRSKTFNNYTLNNLPESFSWKELIRGVKTQGGCGSCWAFATVAMLGEC